jgi:hypothetical protein
MSSTATFKIKKHQEVISEVTLPIPSYYKYGSNYVMLHSDKELTKVRMGGLVDSIEYDNIFGFNPTNYDAITPEEFRAAYNDCEKSIRERTFFQYQHDNTSLTGS